MVSEPGAAAPRAGGQRRAVRRARRDETARDEVAPAVSALGDRAPTTQDPPATASVHRLQRLVGNRAVAGLLGPDPGSAGLVLQRHSNAALAQQVEESKKEDEIGIQRHVDPFRGHEPFNAAPLPPGTRRWRLQEVVPESEVRKYKRALTDMVEATVTDPSTKFVLRRRILGIKVTEAPCTKGAAESDIGLVKIDPSKGEFYTAQFQPHVEAIRGTVIHELFHAASINHEGKPADMVTDADKGFQGASTTVVPVAEGTQETLDEAMTDWLAYEVFTRLYPGKTYTSAYFVKAPKVARLQDAQGIGMAVAGGSTRPYVAASKEQIPMLLQELKLTPSELKRMYLLDHAALGRRIEQGSTRATLKEKWAQHKKERFRETSPLSTNEGLAAVVKDVIAEYREELAQCETTAAQDALLTEILKRQHGLEVKLRAKALKGLAPIAATPGVEEALRTMPAAGDSWRTDDESAPAALNHGFVDKALKELRIESLGSQLAFVLVTKADRPDTPLNAYPAKRTKGPVPGVPFPGNSPTPHAALDHYGGGGYEMALKTAFLNEEHASSYPHYLHEVGHFKQDVVQGYNEQTVSKLILLDYHNILSNENASGHIRTKYATKANMATIMSAPKMFIDVKRDVERDPVLKRLFAEIEAKIEQLPDRYQELTRRNLAYEYFNS